MSIVLKMNEELIPQDSINILAPRSNIKNKDHVKRKKTIKKVIYPIFTSCSEVIEDPFWKQTLDNASRGIFPRGFSYDSDGKYLVQKNKNKIFKTKLFSDSDDFNGSGVASNGPTLGLDTSKPGDSHTDVEEYEKIAYICINEFKKIRGMISQKEHEKAVELLEQYTEEETIVNWNKNNMDIIKAQMISNYVDKKKIELKLDDYACSSLKGVIYLGLYMKWITGDDIEGTNIVINNIKNIGYNKESNLFFIKEHKVQKVKNNTRKQQLEYKKEDKYKIWKNIMHYNNWDTNKSKFQSKLVNNKIQITKLPDNKKVISESSAIASIDSDEE